MRRYQNKDIGKIRDKIICHHCTDIDNLFFSGVSVVAHSFGFVSGLMAGAMVLRDTNETVRQHTFQSYYIVFNPQFSRCAKDDSSLWSGVCSSLALEQPLESTLSDQGRSRISGKLGPETYKIMRIWVNSNEPDNRPTSCSE